MLGPSPPPRLFPDATTMRFAPLPQPQFDCVLFVFLCVKNAGAIGTLSFLFFSPTTVFTLTYVCKTLVRFDCYNVVLQRLSEHCWPKMAEGNQASSG